MFIVILYYDFSYTEKQLADKCDMDGVVEFLESNKCRQYIRNFKNEEIDGSMLYTILASDKADNTLEKWLGVNNPIDMARIKSKLCYLSHTHTHTYNTTTQISFSGIGIML